MGNGKKILNKLFNMLPISEAAKHKAHVAWSEHKIRKRLEKKWHIILSKNYSIYLCEIQVLLSAALTGASKLRLKIYCVCRANGFAEKYQGKQKICGYRKTM